MQKLSQLYLAFFRVGSLTFGGGMAMLPMLKREIVEKKNWTTEEELLDIFAIGQCTPGVIAVNTATYIGYRQAGLTGSIAATLGVVSPSIVIILLIASVLKEFITYPVVQHALTGIRIIVCALMFNSVFGLIKTGVKDHFGALMFLLIFLFAAFSPVPTVLLVLCAAAAGLLIKRREAKNVK